jgi:hypothetical protein
MIEVSRGIVVNDNPRESRLTRADVWRGLKWKARMPVPFVASISSCRIVEEGPGWLVRDIYDNGEPIRERVRFVPEQRVEFDRIDGRVRGRIDNVIEQDAAGELILRFAFALYILGASAGGAEEQVLEREMGEGYAQAVTTTLRAVRRFVTEGIDPLRQTPRPSTPTSQ